MSFAVRTIDYFDVAAKKLGKRYRSFADDLESFKESIKKNPYQGTELSPGIRKVRADASNVKMNVVKAIVKELGFDINKMQSEGVLKPIEIEE